MVKELGQAQYCFILFTISVISIEKKRKTLVRNGNNFSRGDYT